MSAVSIQIPPKLIPVFQGEADIRGAWGGRGSAKTRTFAKMTAIRAFMWDRAGREGLMLCGRQYMNSLADSSLGEIKLAIKSEPWLASAFDIGEKYIKTKSGRISYSFVGLDRNVDSIKSKSRILLGWIDEAEPVTETAYIKLIPTLREDDSELWVTWNPESKRSPTHKRFREGRPDPRVKIVDCNWRDNPWFKGALERTRQRDLIDRPEQYAHIWEGDFATIFVGAYYAKEMNATRVEGRIGNFPWNSELPVHTAWDLGVDDSTAIWFFQIIGKQIVVIDFFEGHGQGAKFYVDEINSKPYKYGAHWFPHDVKVKEWGTGRTRVETLIECGLTPSIVPDHRVNDGIEAVRKTLPKCYFNETTTEHGLDALRQYRTEFDDDKQSFKDKPRHDWTSHAADAKRYLAMAYKFITEESKPEDKPLGIPLNELTYDQFFEFGEGDEKRERV